MFLKTSTKCRQKWGLNRGNFDNEINDILNIQAHSRAFGQFFDNRISKRISTPISETFLCENVTVTYTA